MRKREEKGGKASFLGILHAQDDPRWDRFLFEVNQLFSIHFQSVLVLSRVWHGICKAPFDRAVARYSLRGTSPVGVKAVGLSSSCLQA
ncbi:MAG: hypothetical protein EBS79_08935 [Gammaproteobacteria bacterium]|nr:hypothetical protein [Gammaproteobacteria bacterium]